MEAARSKVAEVCDAPAEGPGAPRVSCRFTHVYPDGPAPYFTVMAPAVRGGEVEQWDEIKAAASEAVIEAGGTITHHHAVGRDHRPWYDRQRPAPFAAALRAAKAELDPHGILNPGVLIDPSCRAAADPVRAFEERAEARRCANTVAERRDRDDVEALEAAQERGRDGD